MAGRPWHSNRATPREESGEPAVFRRYRLVAGATDYLPDPGQPVDRWYQAVNSSNARTTSRMLTNHFRRVGLLVDPFAGAGSTAVVARRLRVPFIGIDIDPVLACVTIAKTMATRDHVRTLLDVEVDGSDTVPACLDLIRRLRDVEGRPLTVEDIAADIRQLPPPDPRSKIVWGDATDERTWLDLVPKISGTRVIYTSPPFDLSSPRPEVPGDLVDRAEQILQKADKARIDHAPAVFSTYGDLAAGMLKQAAKHLGPATLIMEYEPPDSHKDDRVEVIDRLWSEAATDVREVLVGRAFSRRGRLSFIHGEVRP